MDIHPYQHKSKNTIAVLVQGGVRNSLGNLKIIKHLPGLTAIIVAGNQQFVTDTTWLCSEKVPEQMWNEFWTWSCILDSADANTPDFNWQIPGFDDRNWSPALQISGEAWGTLSPRYIPRLKETDLGSGTLLQVRNGKIADISVRKLPENLPLILKSGDEAVIDAGKLSLIYWVVKIKAEKGTEIIFTPCQDFVKGEKIINYSCESKFTAREGIQSFMSTETFGFRYLNIKVLNGAFALDSIRFMSRLYPNIRLAGFECSDDFLNRAWQQSSYTSEVLCEDGYVDSAERAE